MAHPPKGRAGNRRESLKKGGLPASMAGPAGRCARQARGGPGGHALVQAGRCDWLWLARRRTRVRYPETVRFARLLLT